MVDIGDLLQACVQHNASDLHLTVGKPPTLRVDSALMCLSEEPLIPSDTESLMKSITSSDNQARIQQVGGVDFGLGYEKIARFRVSVFKQKGYYGMSLRLMLTSNMTHRTFGPNPAITNVSDASAIGPSVM